jgi:hypothetical protein
MENNKPNQEQVLKHIQSAIPQAVTNGTSEFIIQDQLQKPI